jgi:hypothetical protein
MPTMLAPAVPALSPCSCGVSDDNETFLMVLPPLSLPLAPDWSSHLFASGACIVNGFRRILDSR